MDRELKEHELDAALRGYLSAELDGQLGRAERAFREHLAMAHPAAAAAPARPRRRRAHRLWLIGAVGTAAAASVAAMWAVPVVPPHTGEQALAVTQPGGGSGRIESTGPGQQETPALSSSATQQASAEPTPQWEQVEQVVNSLTVDKGLVVLEDNTPARLVRRVAVERTEWVDERSGVRVETVVPREDVQLISLDTF